MQQSTSAQRMAAKITNEHNKFTTTNDDINTDLLDNIDMMLNDNLDDLVEIDSDSKKRELPASNINNEFIAKKKRKTIKKGNMDFI